MIEIKFAKLSPAAVIPRYAHSSAEDAGMDLVAAEGAVLEPFEPRLVKTGLCVQMPPGIEAQIRPRSGLALKHGITVHNSPGTIDPGYRGEVSVMLIWSPNRKQHPECYPDIDRQALSMPWPSFRIKPGDRIAQIVFARYERVKAVWEQDLTRTERGQNGFGSTGVESFPTQ